MQNLNPTGEAMRRRIQSLKRYPGEPHLRDILKREYDEARADGRNEALESWGPSIEDELRFKLAERRQIRVRALEGPEME